MYRARRFNKARLRIYYAAHVSRTLRLTRRRIIFQSSVLLLACVALMLCASAQQQRRQPDSGTQAGEEFGPIVRAYLGYLRSEQTVTDDRASHREISPAYYRRNSNRIRALR